MRENEPLNAARAFWLTFGLGALLVAASFGLAGFLDIRLLSLLAPSPDATAAGIAATAPLVALLAWFMASSWRPIAEFRRSQLQFFREIGFKFTIFRIVLLSLIAGIGEELFFRGVLQTLLDRHAPTFVAILIPNLLFGALHARTKIYAFAAFAVGVWLGLLYWMTESLLAPIVTHALYDFIALEWTRRVLKRAPPSPEVLP